ncbi:VanW family protein [Bacillus sp. FJAT-47783]|uniref:VanW family protein n=1 Tax=Bacillus sp. FJAT-47783 TaxID=2922712 RepID=UPI001FAC41E3|nr:VanW family protein [Bacillus sp. FJAT-47783]
MNLLFVLLLLNPLSNSYSDHLSLIHKGDLVDSLSRDEFVLPPFKHLINNNKLNQYINKLEKEVYEEPVAAYIDEYGKIIPDIPGQKLDKKQFLASFYSYFFTTGPASMEIPVNLIYAKVDSELLANIRTKRISSYITYFNSQNHPRTHNIELATKAINNYVIFPGERFSFNQVVGKRTIEKGYLPAPVIVKGEVTEGVGGGICQVSSTLFNAVDKATVQIIQRYSHSKRVPYVPPNRDATVSWYGPDFIFKNQHNQPLLIQAKVSGGQLIVDIYSSEDIHIEKKREVPNAPKKLPSEVDTNKHILD